jgi:uncharacterized protein (DUF58 family)
MAALTPEAYLRPEIIRQVQRFDLKAKFMMEGFLAGLHSSPYKGFSVEFSEHRKYVQGDDVRSIDWKLWSRTNRYYVKQYEAETHLTGHLIVDISASMGYVGPTQTMSKLEYSTYLAGAMAYLMVHQQDPVGLITCGEKIKDCIKPRSKSSHLLTILRVLANTQPSGSTHLAACLHQAAEIIDHRGMVMIFSDLLDDAGDSILLDALSHLRYRGHDVILFHILDAAETQFPFKDLTQFEDTEGTLSPLVADPLSIRDAYLAEIAKFREYFQAECVKRRIDFIPIDTATSFDKALMAYLRKRVGS